MGARYTLKPLRWAESAWREGVFAEAVSLGRKFRIYALSDGGGFQMEDFADWHGEPDVTAHPTLEAAKTAAETVRLQDLLGEIEVSTEPPPEVVRAGEALLALQRWCRKSYVARIDFGPSYQPGDEGYVELKAAGREVQVGFIDCDVWDEEKEEGVHTGDATDAIMEALRLWHADDTPKVFRVIVYHGADFVRPDSTLGTQVRPWGANSTEFVLTAPNEAAAIAVAERLVPDDHRSVHAREVRTA